MKSIILGLFVLIINIQSIESQDILWKKNYGLNQADDIGKIVIEASDGGIIIVGWTGSFSQSNDIWLIKCNQDGDTLWTKIYGGLADDYGYAIKELDDGGFLLSGATYSFGNGGADFYLIRTNSDGDTLWTRTYGGVTNDFCFSMEKVTDGFVLAGKTGNYDLYIVKVDQNGNQIWAKEYGSPGEDLIYSIFATQTNELYLAAQWNYSGFLIKLNESGDSLWAKDLPLVPHSITDTDSNKLVLTGTIWAGSESANVVLAITDTLGNVEWEKTYDYDNDYDIGYSVAQTVDGGYIVCGGANIYDWISHGWIIRTNASGDTLWTKYIKGYPNLMKVNTNSLDSYFSSIIQMSNGDYVCTGIKAQDPLNDQIWLVRISSDIVPVELTSFTATVMRNSVSLNWQTATETNNSGFEIERRSLSPNPSPKEKGVFKTIAFVPGFGTTTDPKSYSFIDQNLTSGKYQYRLKQIDFDGSFEYSQVVEVEISSPTEFALEQNYPNPFNPTTKIKYTIPSVTLSLSKGDIFVTLRVFDILGNEVATLVNENKPAGSYEVEFNVGQTSSLSSGVYYYQLRAGSFVETKKMILLR